MTEIAPPRFVPRLLVSSALVGVLAERTLHGHSLGLSVVLLHLGLTAALLWTGGAEVWATHRVTKALWCVSGGFAAMLAVYDSDALAALNVAAWLTTGLAAWLAWNGGRRPWLEWTAFDWLRVPLAACLHGVAAAFRVLRHAIAVRDVLRVGGALGPLVRSLLVVVPVVAVFLALLTSADVVFNDIVGRLFRALAYLPLPELVDSATFWFASTLVVVGALGVATARRTADAEVSTEPTALGLGRTERLSLLWSVTALLATFDASTARCALGPAVCALPDGVTYAQYVHAGFGQLVAAATLVLTIVLVLNRHAPPPSTDAHHTLASTALVLVALPLVASGTARLHLYETAYGFTVQRVLAQASTLLIGAWLAWRGVTLWVAPRRFVPGAVALTLACIASLDALNLDGFIAARNVERLADMGEVDRVYLSTLSADVLPALESAEAAASSEAGVALHFSASLVRARRCRDQAWPAWSASCHRAERPR